MCVKWKVTTIRRSLNKVPAVPSTKGVMAMAKFEKKIRSFNLQKHFYARLRWYLMYVKKGKCTNLEMQTHHGRRSLMQPTVIGRHSCLRWWRRSSFPPILCVNMAHNSSNRYVWTKKIYYFFAKAITFFFQSVTSTSFYYNRVMVLIPSSTDKNGSSASTTQHFCKISKVLLFMKT